MSAEWSEDVGFWDAHAAREPEADFSKNYAKQLKRLQGQELQNALNFLVAEAGRCYSERRMRSDRALYLVMENIERLDRPTQATVMHSFREAVPEGYQARGVQQRVARWKENQVQFDLLDQLKILSDPTASQADQETALRMVLGASCDYDSTIGAAISSWRPRERLKEATLVALLQRIASKYGGLGYEDTRSFFPKWEDWLTWVIRPWLQNPARYSFWHYLSQTVFEEEKIPPALAFFFVYQVLLEEHLSRERFCLLLRRLVLNAHDLGAPGFARRLLQIHRDLLDEGVLHMPEVVPLPANPAFEVQRCLGEKTGNGMSKATALVVECQLQSMYSVVWHALIQGKYAYCEDYLAFAAYLAINAHRRDWLEIVYSRCRQKGEGKSNENWLTYGAAYQAMRLCVRYLDLVTKFTTPDQAEDFVTKVYTEKRPTDPIVLRAI